jgi:predicted AlkP superfamily pyrophosphatase or phosphodiesterase
MVMSGQMTPVMRRRPRSPALALAVAVLAAAIGASAAPRQTGNPNPPKPAPSLVVILVVDQMRADYIERFKNDWTGGLRRLVIDGAWYRKAAYPYLTTVTCAGHSTIATGSFPLHHGIFQNFWWDRAERALTFCMSDPDAKDIGYGGVSLPGGESAHNIRVPTFADEIRTEQHGRVVALSLKSAAAISLAGHGGDAVTWLTLPGGVWATSSAYTTTPVPAVDAFARANPIAADYGKSWTRLLNPARYQDVDGVGEAPPRGWTTAFPHVLKGAGKEPDADFVLQWEASPFADEYLGRFAAALTRSMQLGQQGRTDVLAVSFSSPDVVGHAFGPRSPEIQDMYAHLDRTIGRLLEDLDRTVGAGKYVVALTGDHGVTPIPEQLVAEGREGGRLNSATIAAAIEQHLKKALGDGTRVARVNGNDVYFEPGVYDQLSASPAVLASLIEKLTRLDGIERVFRSEEARDGAGSSDRLVRAASLSYVPGRSGDLILVPRGGWMFAAAGTTHATAGADDQQVPIVLFGFGIKRGEYTDAATPADIAPTLAALSGVSMPNVDGRVLREALK